MQEESENGCKTSNWFCYHWRTYNQPGTIEPTNWQANTLYNSSLHTLINVWAQTNKSFENGRQRFLAALMTRRQEGGEEKKKKKEKERARGMQSQAKEEGVGEDKARDRQRKEHARNGEEL